MRIKSGWKWWCILLLGITTIAFFLLKEKNAEIHAAQRTDKSKLRHSEFLESANEFMAFQGEPLSAKYSEVLSVKLVFDKKSNQLYFLNHQYYTYHFEFCEGFLGFKGSLGSFNAQNYIESQQQRFFLANLNYYKSLNKYAIELTSSTIYSTQNLEFLHEQIRTNSYIKDSLFILVNSDYLMALADNYKLKLPKLYPDEIYNNQQFQLLEAGTSYGYLRALENIDLSYKDVKPTDIILIKGTPIQIPLCAAIITETFQTPLSHIQILARNRKIPSAALRQAWKDEELKKFINKPVKLTLTSKGYQIELCKEDKVKEYYKQKNNIPPIRLKADYHYRELPEGAQLRLKLKKKVGMKAAALGELQFLSTQKDNNWKVPEGLFAIPFYYYHEHMKHDNIQKALGAVVNENLNPEELSNALKQLRTAIKKTPVDKHLLKMVETKMTQNKHGDSYRFRSSSNAEDLDGFSGAGLYASKTGILNHPTKSVETAILTVWASIWSEKAFQERKIHHIDQNTVAMAVVCHRNFPSEAANGVAITRNIYRPGFNGFSINVQPGEHSVVEPDNISTCEQLILMPASNINPTSGNISADYISYSSYSRGKRVLSHTQLESLYYSLNAVKNYFYLYSDVGGGSNNEFYDYGLDIEFKFENNGDLYLKQVRFYP